MAAKEPTSALCPHTNQFWDSISAQKQPFKHRIASSKVRSEAPCPDGTVIPTKRSVYAYQGDCQPVWDPLLVRIDIGEIALA